MLEQIAVPNINSRRDAAVEWLKGRINFERTLIAPYNERQLDLDRMRTLLVRLGQPDAGLRIVHVAGTKGKGSTSSIIAGILTAAGYHAGVFSSPHLERIEERFSIDGVPCTGVELASLVDELRPVVAAMDAEAAAEGESQGGPTYFECTTAIALLYFAQRRVDAAVLEVGLGGRLDSTNVCSPVVSVITSIGFDHMQQLGNTLAAIAGEKAGIIKPGVPVVTGVTQREPLDVIERIAQEHGCPLIHAEPNDLLASVQLAMPGEHQRANAAVALATIAELRRQGWCISDDAMRDGLTHAKLPGRIEVVFGKPTVVIDTAHNPASAQALAATLADMPRHGRRTLILAVSCDKDVAGIVQALAPHFDRIVATQYLENPRAIPAGDLASVVRTELDRVDLRGRPAERVEILATPREAWESVCRSAEPDELVCIAGSFYLAAELRPVVLPRQDAGQGSPRQDAAAI
jgi:dihydrofolate synthase/folylpolyglutamate synthase